MGLEEKGIHLKKQCFDVGIQKK